MTSEHSIDDDAAELATCTFAGERALELLPAPADRNAAQREEADRIHGHLRRLRQQFLDVHADTVYDLLTCGHTSRLRLSALVAAAAKRFPGLVPDTLKMAQDRARPQVEKEGWEIDQSLFVAAVLRSARSGEHLMDTMLDATERARDLLPAFTAAGEITLDRVHIRIEGAAAHVTVHNQRCLNAEDDALIADLETAVDLVALHDDVRVGVLRGGEMTHPKYRGQRVFSAGINLVDLQEGRISYLDFLLGRELGYVSKLLHGVCTDDADGDRVQRAWVAVVDAFAIGGGLQLLLAVDHVVAIEGAMLSLPAAQEGIVPGLGSFRIGRYGGSRLARQVVLRGRVLRAGDPDAACLVDETVGPGEVDDAVKRAVDALTPAAVAENRRMLALAEEPRAILRPYLAEFAIAQARRIYAEDVLAKARRPGAIERSVR